jgi:hypothetical protein
VPAFWVMDPLVTKPSLTVFELAAGRYWQTAQVSGDEPYRAAASGRGKSVCPDRGAADRLGAGLLV